MSEDELSTMERIEIRLAELAEQEAMWEDKNRVLMAQRDSIRDQQRQLAAEYDRIAVERDRLRRTLDPATNDVSL